MFHFSTFLMKKEQTKRNFDSFYNCDRLRKISSIFTQKEMESS